MSILIAGEICHQVKGVFKTQRLMKYGVLYDRSPENHPCIELYDSQDDYYDCLHKNKKVDAKKIDLHQIKTVTNQTQATSKGKEYHLEVRTKKEKNNFLFDNENDSLNWGRVLKKFLQDSSDKTDEPSSSSLTAISDDDDESVTINAMYGGAQEVKKFEVNVESTDLAKLCNIEGTRNLLVSSTTIAFENLTTRQIDFTFQIEMLRRFGKKEGIFSFEVGRKCENGPGNIKCKTEAANFINELIARQSNSRGTTKIPSMPLGIENAKNKVQSVIEKQLSAPDVSEDTGISGPALHVHKRHPGLAKGPALIPLKQTRENDEEIIPKRDSQKRLSEKSDGGSDKHGPVTDQFAKQLDVLIDPHNKESVKMKDKDRDSKKKENEKKKEEKELKKKEEKEKKEMKDKEKKQKEQSKKDGKKVKEKIQQPATSKVLPGGFYEEVDIIDLPPSSTHKDNGLQSHYSEPITHTDVNGDETAESSTTEYSTPLKVKPSNIQAEYTDVKIVKGNAWKSLGRSEDEEKHEEDYSEIRSVRGQFDQAPPPLPGRGYEDQEEEESLYNHIHMKTSLPKNPAHQQTENIYGMASATKVRPIKNEVLIPEADYNESDSGESAHDDTYDVPDYDTYDAPTTITNANSTKKATNSFKEATPKPLPTQKATEESFYDEVT